MWRIETIDNTIVTEYGQLDGKLQETRDTLTQGKNIGRSNETTPAEQACAEALARWEGKVKKGYVENLDDAQAGKVNTEVITGGILPMLAHPYSKQGHKIKFAAYIQPKIDGHRAICMKLTEDGPWTLWSRTH